MSSDLVGAVLCAGFGTRLRPLTEALPKPLVPFLNAPMLSYALDHQASAGVRRVGLNVHHLPDKVPPVVDGLCERLGLEPSYSHESEILGTAGGIRGIWDALDRPDATLVVSNGDSIMNIDLEKHYRRHLESGADVTLVVRPKIAGQPGKVWVDGDGRLRGLRDSRHPEAREEELTEYEFIGVHFIEPSVLETIELEKSCIVGDVYCPMLEGGLSISASLHDDFWAGLDNPDLHFDYTRRLLDEPNQFEQFPVPADERDSRGPDGVYLMSDDLDVAKIEWEPPVLVGRNVTIEPGAKIGPYAVIDDVDVEEGASVENAILYGLDEPVDGEWRDYMAVDDRVAELEDE